MTDKGWNPNNARVSGLKNSESLHHWMLLKSLAPDNKNFELRMRIATDDEMKRAERLPKCNYDDPNPFN